MIAFIVFPDLPALALQMALGTRKQLLVYAGGRVVAPYELAGMPIDRARTVRPHACPLTRQPALERAAWERIVEEVFAFTPLISEVGVGRLFCAPDNMPALRQLMEKTHARVGLAHTRTMALLAAIGARPGGLITVDDDDVVRYLDELPVERLREIPELELDEVMAERLRLFGLSTVGRVRRLTRAQLQAQFGQPGLRLHDLLFSIAEQSPLPLHVPPPMVEVIVPAYEPTNEPAHFEALLHEGLCQAMAYLGAQRTGRVELALLDAADQPQHTTARILRAPTGEVSHLRAQTSAMLATLITHHQSRIPHTSSAIRIRFGALSLIPPTQTTLFPHSPTLADVTTPMVRRFPQAIKRVTVLDPHAYLPDRFASLEPWKPVA